MFVIIGIAVVIVSVLTGYMGAGGHLEVLFQPLEVLIIGGAAFGAFLIGNPKYVIFGTLKSFPILLRGSRHSKATYLELFSLLYAIFKLAKTKGDLALESHVEKPEESSLFQKFPKFSADHHSRDFLCDYLRLLTLGTNNAHEIESIIDEEIEAHHHEQGAISGAITTMADAMPALGIVAAVLGVIHTMGSITEPPEVLGHLIGGALVGTFMGVLLAYGFVNPLAKRITFNHRSHFLYYRSMVTSISGFATGMSPLMSIEVARRALDASLQPSSDELESLLKSALAAPAAK